MQTCEQAFIWGEIFHKVHSQFVNWGKTYRGSGLDTTYVPISSKGWGWKCRHREDKGRYREQGVDPGIVLFLQSQFQEYLLDADRAMQY